jgi:hypothetical protein
MSPVNDVVKNHPNPVNGNRHLSQLFAMTFQSRSYERSCFGRTVLVPYLTYFRTVRGLGNSETMKLHGPFRGKLRRRYICPFTVLSPHGASGRSVLECDVDALTKNRRGLLDSVELNAIVFGIEQPTNLCATGRHSFRHLSPRDMLRLHRFGQLPGDNALGATQRAGRCWSTRSRLAGVGST